MTPLFVLIAAMPLTMLSLPEREASAWSAAPIEAESCRHFAAESVNRIFDDSFKQDAAQAGLTLRVVEKDGERFIVTMDYHINRLNLHLERGRIKAASC